MPAATPDNLVWPVIEDISHCSVEEGALCVTWKSGLRSRYHPIWLRDNCACEQCLHSVTREHLFDVRDIALDIKIDAVEKTEGGEVCVTWSHNAHTSEYHPGWLYAHSGLLEEEHTTPELWDSSVIKEPISFQANQGVVDDELLHQVLLALKRWGLVRIQGMSTDEDVVEALGLRIGPIRETHFARVFDVVSRPDGDSNAYTSEELAAHTDIPTRETPPGLQLLHCLVADAEGGLSTMTDGFKLAADLHSNHPKEFANLSSTKWCFANRAGETDYRWNTPIIVLDDHGQVNDVRLLPFSRAPLRVEFDEIEPAYAALQLFMNMANSSKYQIRYPFNAGDLIIFDNRRILHGRGEFYPQTGDRELRGVYVDRDDLDSKLRQFKNNKMSL